MTFYVDSEVLNLYFLVLNSSQTLFQNILWRNSPQHHLQCIDLLIVTKGTNCAPYLAIHTRNLLATSSSNHELASQALLQQTYVDDILSGTDSHQKLETLYL